MLRRRLELAAAATLIALVAFLTPLTGPPSASAAGVWQGQVGSQDANVRQTPSQSAPILGQIKAGSTINVTEWVIGETVVGTNHLWGHLTGGGYIYSGLVTKKASTPPPPTAPTSGRWIDVNLTQQIVTAYQGNSPVFSVVASTGEPGWETPVGTFPILRRVANETMDSNTLAVGVSRAYRLTNVLWTQYLTGWGHSLHSNYWKTDSPFGVPTSHGCIGMVTSDAAKVWNFATVGTPVVIHY